MRANTQAFTASAIFFTANSFTRRGKFEGDTEAPDFRVALDIEKPLI